MRAGLTVVLSLMMIGCGAGDTPELAEVDGRVQLDGNPLPDATLIFTPKAGGRSAKAVTDSGGDYELLYSADHAGAPPGQYSVQITTATVKPDEQGNDVIVPEKLPARYNAKSELEKEIVPGDNTINFELESTGEIHQPGQDDRTRTERPPSCS